MDVDHVAKIGGLGHLDNMHHAAARDFFLLKPLQMDHVAWVCSCCLDSKAMRGLNGKWV